MDYKEIAQRLRRTVIRMIHKAQSSHVASNFSCADLLTVIYMNADLEKDQVLCKSWASASVYALLAEKGVIPKEDLEQFGVEGTPYITVLEPTVPTIRAATGAMGYHLPFAVGFALAKKLKQQDGIVYCLISDGELGIGSTWECALIAVQHRLDNLVMIVDKNGLQAMGKVNEILATDPVDRKFEAFGWDTMNVDGHDHESIDRSLRQAVSKKSGLPTVLIANTVKGKGVSFMENENLWHYSHVNQETLEKALIELK